MNHALSLGDINLTNGIKAPGERRDGLTVPQSLTQMCANLVLVEGEGSRKRWRLVDPTARDVV